MKFGVIGTNFVTDFFMAGAAQVAECEVVAVCGTSLEKAKGLAKNMEFPMLLILIRRCLNLS